MKTLHQVILLCLILLLSFLTQNHFAKMHISPTGDDGHFIDVADNILQGRGYISRVKHHFYPFNDAVEHIDDARQPLVPYLFALLFYFTGASFEATKLFLIVINMLNIVTVYVIGRTLFNGKAALLSALVVGLYPTQIFFWAGFIQSSEPVFIFLFMVLVLLTLHIRDNKAWWMLIGVVCGLLYLTRANGLWLLLPLGIYMYLQKEHTDLKKACLTLAGFLVVCLPWFVRTFYHFGNPIYTSAQHNYWLDSFWLFHADLGYVPGLIQYLNSHSMVQILERALIGVYMTFKGFLLAGTGFATFTPFFLFSILNNRDQFRRSSFFYFSILMTCIALIGYVPDFSKARFFVPFHPLIILWSIGGVFQFAKLLGSNGLGKSASMFSSENVFILGTAAMLLFPPVTRLVDNYKANDFDKAQRLRTVSHWIQENTGEDQIIMMYPYDDLHQYVFLYDRKTVFMPNNDCETILRVAAKYEVDYIVISKRLLLDREKGFYNFWMDTPDGVRERRQLDFVGLVYAHNDGSLLIYRLQRSFPQSGPGS